MLDCKCGHPYKQHCFINTDILRTTEDGLSTIICRAYDDGILEVCHCEQYEEEEK